jgi:glycosyltransferase involved in cell wall biosynthesis
VNQILLYSFYGIAGIQLCYWTLLYARVLFHKDPPVKSVSELPPVSIVVCARAEAKNIMELVPILYEQNYPKFEVLIVNDRSWDDTKEILEALKIKYPQLRFIDIEENERHHFSGKKMALTLGIKGATYENIVFTDADCRPQTELWLQHMISAYAPGKTIVLGYSPYKKRKGFLNRLIRFDTYAIAMNYISMAKAGMPYMGVGRNMSYTKAQHFLKGGFRNHYHIASGDDDLFVNQNSDKGNTALVIHPNSHVESFPKTTFDDWKRQKIRHMTSSGMYQLKHKIILGAYSATVVLFYILLALTLLLNKTFLISLTILGVRTLFQIVTFRGSSKWLGNKDVALLAPFYEIIVLTLNASFYFKSLFAKKSKWN